ncbi:MAG: hypothetical protein ACOY3P_20070 [Planctomycetota bacterium]
MTVAAGDARRRGERVVRGVPLSVYHQIHRRIRNSDGKLSWADFETAGVIQPSRRVEARQRIASILEAVEQSKTKKCRGRPRKRPAG